VEREAGVNEPTAYEFEDIRVDLARLEVTRAGQPVTLEPKAFDVLRVLIHGRDRLVSKEEILDAVWRDTFVTPNVLTRAVAQLRKALGDEAKDSRYIQTVATRGYRFIAPVRVVEAGASVDVPARDVRHVPPTPTARWPSRRWPVWAAIALTLLTVTVATAWIAGRARSDDAPGAFRTRRVTTRNGYHGMAAVSPDGRLVAYASERDTGLEIVVTGITAGSAELAVTADEGQNMQPSWSPDGQWLAFHSRKRRGVWIVPASGGTARQIVDFGSDPAWAPDGSRLAFTSDAGGMASQSVLWTVGRDGQDLRPLTAVGQPPGGHHEPTYSWSGREVAFVVRRGGWTDELWRVPAAGGQPSRVIADAAITQPQFGPGDRAIYWSATVDNGLGRLWRLALDVRGGTPQPILTLDSGRIDGLSIARSGAVAFSIAATDSNIWSVGTGDGVSEPQKLTDDVGRSTYPDYSPDGRIAFAHVVAGNPVTSWLISEDGRARERLVPDLTVGRPQWVADGTRLLVFQPGVTSHQLAWVDLATRRVAPVPVDTPGISSPRVSPDGRTIAYHVIQPDGVMNAFTRPLDGSGPAVQVTHDREAASYPAWSPDGRWLAIELKREDTTQLAVVPAAGGAIEQLTAERGQTWPHSWSPDGDRIAFAGQRGGVWNIWTVSRRTRQTRPLTRFTSATGFVRYPSWSPRGDRIAFERARITASVWAGVAPLTQ
jgi:Tol biopolymer transport system component/DNA-binding winged helix-turn-helix (wHTH) protein